MRNYFLWFLVCLPISVWAQSGLEAYDRGSLSEALSIFQSGTLGMDEVDFLRAAMTTDADSALEKYQQVVLRNPKSPVAPGCLERIRQYYYAQGLYTRAEEIQKSIGVIKRPDRRLRPPESTPPPPFNMSPSILPLPPAKQKPLDEKPAIIEKTPQANKRCELQVGAFTSLNNAKKLQAQMKEAGYNVKILSPPEQSTILHLVRIVGFTNESAATAAAEKLRDQFNLKPILFYLDGNEQ